MRGSATCALLMWAALRADAAFERLGVSPLSQGTAGNPALPLFSPWSVLENPAAAAGLNACRVLAAVSPSPFGLAELTAARIGAIVPTTLGSLALDLSSSGFALYRESAVNVSAAFRLTDDIDVGIRTTLYALSIAGYGSGLAGGVDLGACWRPARNICLGWTVLCVNAPALDRFRERLPAVMNIGCAVAPLPWSELTVDVRQEAELPTECRFGCTLQLHRDFSIRLATSDNPSEMICGADVSVLPVLMCYRLSVHPSLGVTHTIGLCYQPGK